MNITQFNPSSTSFENLQLTDKVYLVTGAAGAIGSALAMELGKRGATIILVFINEDHRCTTLAQCLRQGAADRSSGTGDELYLIIKLYVIDGKGR